MENKEIRSSAQSDGVVGGERKSIETVACTQQSRVPQTTREDGAKTRTFHQTAEEHTTVWRKIFIGSLIVYAVCFVLMFIISGSFFPILFVLADFFCFYAFIISRKVSENRAARVIFIVDIVWLVITNVLSFFEITSTVFLLLMSILDFLCVFSFFFVFEGNKYERSPVVLYVFVWSAFIVNMGLSVLSVFNDGGLILIFIVITKIIWLACLAGLKNPRTYIVRGGYYRDK